MSFSLYLIHFPCVALIGGFFYRGSKLPPDLAGVACFGLWLMVLLLCGYAFYWAFERRTELVRQWIERF
jgi:peptidoglycan/LPS O-acetylase OafA/YrhL